MPVCTPDQCDESVRELHQQFGRPSELQASEDSIFLGFVVVLMACFVALVGGLWWALSLLFPSVAYADCGRAHPRDVSYAVSQYYAGAQYLYCGDVGEYCTQRDRVGMESYLDGIVIPGLMRAFRDIPGGSGAVAFASDQLTKAHLIETGGPYEPGKMRSGGVWFVRANGNHYDAEKATIAKFRSAALQQRRRCATDLSPDQLTVLSLKVVNGLCAPDTRSWTPPKGGSDKSRIYRGLINAHATNLVPWTQRQLDEIHAAVAAHKAASDSHCGGPAVDHDSVQNALETLENDPTLNPSQQALVTLKRFEGANDGWSADDLCRWGIATHAAFDAWGDAVIARDWVAADDMSTLHGILHRMQGLRGFDYTMHLFQPDKPPSRWPVLNAEGVLAFYFGPRPR